MHHTLFCVAENVKKKSFFRRVVFESNKMLNAKAKDAKRICDALSYVESLQE